MFPCAGSVFVLLQHGTGDFNGHSADKPTRGGVVVTKYGTATGNMAAGSTALCERASTTLLDCNMIKKVGAKPKLSKGVDVLSPLGHHN